MKLQLLEVLVCPVCLPAEAPMQIDIIENHENDIETGILTCSQCSATFPINEGIAHLDPKQNDFQTGENKYETEEVVSSYLWSHYGELFDPENCSKAYTTWSEMMQPHGGIAIDAGGAVGRFTFEMSSKCDFSIGIDTSVAFIKAARELMKIRQMNIQLKEEGFLTKEVHLALPEQWRSDKVEFLVANAMALPFRAKSVSSFASLNLVDKVPSPIKHLEEMNRITRDKDVQFLLSDPFSWSTEAAPVDEWLGGKIEGPFAGQGLDNIDRLLEEDSRLAPAWKVETKDKVWWKIRTHTNHFELIQSCFLKTSR